MNEESYEYQMLFDELNQYERTGIKIRVDGHPASPMQVVSAHLIQEDSTYMRDYVIDEDGNLEELCFHSVKNDE